MKILRLILLTFTALLLIAAVVLPGFIGPAVEKIWQQQLARSANVEVEGFQRNWFASEALSHLRGKKGITELHSNIQHGPVLFTESGPRLGFIYAKTRLSGQQLEPALREQLETYYGPITAELNKSPLLIETLVGFDRRIINKLQLLPIERNEGKEQISFSGMMLLLETDIYGKQLLGSFELGEFTRMQQGRELLHFSSAKGEYQLTPAGSGEATMNMPLLRAKSIHGPLELHDLQLSYYAERLSAGVLDIVTDLQIPEIQASIPITALQQQLSLPGISHADLHHYLYTLLLTPAPKRNWVQILQRPLQLQQQLDTKSTTGPTQLQLDVHWQGMPRTLRRNSQQPYFWLNALSGNMQLNATEQTLLNSPLGSQAKTLRNYGLLLEKNGRLQMNLNVNKGNLKINGQALPADLFILALSGKF
ncbi:MAG: YdgA family protein [Gammaproteobacteria bacterium]|nr:YdgA family protein [Gammaproteobacteria bacterium]